MFTIIYILEILSTIIIITLYNYDYDYSSWEGNFFTLLNIVAPIIIKRKLKKKYTIATGKKS